MNKWKIVIVAIGIALPLGVLSGSRKNSLIDNFSSFFALLGISLPTFVIGPFLVYLFAVKLGWFSPTGSLYPEPFQSGAGHQGLFLRH